MDVKIDDTMLKISESVVDIIIIGVILKILIPFQLDVPALSRLVRENAPIMSILCPFCMKYSAKNSTLLQPALGDGRGVCNKIRILRPHAFETVDEMLVNKGSL